MNRKARTQVRKANRKPTRPGAWIGLTGGIGCGKSEAARMLRSIGVPVRDADAVVHALLAPGTNVYRRVVQRFGRDVLKRNGRIDRRGLGRRIFASQREREALNAIVHPAVRREIDRWLAVQRLRGRRAVAVVPLLYEVGWLEPWDAVVCVTAPRDVVLQRLKQRGLNRSEARARLAAQWPVAEKARRADYVIRNSGTLRDLRRDVLKVWKDIRERS